MITLVCFIATMRVVVLTGQLTYFVVNAVFNFIEKVINVAL